MTGPAGLILAAGSGTRFGSEPKLLAGLDGRPLLEHAIAAQAGVAELAPIVVVLGAGSEEILQRVEFGRAEPVVCPEWRLGQSRSLRFGLEVLGETDKVIVTLGDEPLITPEVVRLFLDQPGGARAAYGGRPGHPAVLGRAELRAARELSGDRGARELLTGPQIECSERCSGRDVDTPSDLEAIRNEARAVL